jgi:putative membrane protein
MIYGTKLKRGLIWSLALVGLNSMYSGPALAMGGWHNNWNMGPGMMGGWGTGWFGMIFMIAFWGLVIFAIVSVVRLLLQRYGRGGNSIASSNAQAIEILNERYARGEISREEYEFMKKVILR